MVWSQFRLCFLASKWTSCSDWVCMYKWIYIECMYGWMYGCMSVCMDVCMDVWMNGSMDRWMHACMYVYPILGPLSLALNPMFLDKTTQFLQDPLPLLPASCWKAAQCLTTRKPRQICTLEHIYIYTHAYNRHSTCRVHALDSANIHTHTPTVHTCSRLHIQQLLWWIRPMHWKLNGDINSWKRKAEFLQSLGSNEMEHGHNQQLRVVLDACEYVRKLMLWAWGILFCS